MHIYGALEKERKGQGDLQRERNFDSWRNTDAKEETQCKPEGERQSK